MSKLLSQETIEMDAEYEQLSFWVAKPLLSYIDDYLKQNRYEINVDFVVKCLRIVVENPYLLRKEYLKNLEFDRKILFSLLQLLNSIPCEFEFDGSKEEIIRIQEIQKELGV